MVSAVGSRNALAVDRIGEARRQRLGALRPGEERDAALAELMVEGPDRRARPERRVREHDVEPVHRQVGHERFDGVPPGRRPASARPAAGPAPAAPRRPASAGRRPRRPSAGAGDPPAGRRACHASPGRGRRSRRHSGRRPTPTRVRARPRPTRSKRRSFSDRSSARTWALIVGCATPQHLAGPGDAALAGDHPEVVEVVIIQVVHGDPPRSLGRPRRSHCPSTCRG